MNALLSSNKAQGALGIFLLMLALIGAAVLFTKSMVDTRQVEIDARTMEVEALRRRVQMPPPPAVAADDGANVFLEGENYALAVNTLQQRVVGLVEQSGGKLSTVGVDPAGAEAKGASRPAVLQIAAEFDNDGLQSFLYELEAERPLVMVDSLTVRRPASAATDAAPADTPRLNVDLRVIGYYRKAAP